MRIASLFSPALETLATLLVHLSKQSNVLPASVYYDVLTCYGPLLGTSSD